MSNGGVNVAALGFGGIDTSNLVSSLVSIAQQPYNQLAAQQQNINAAQSTISSFSNTLSQLKTAALALSDPSSFQSTAATSSDPSVVATVQGSAAPGQWSVSVSSVAEEQRTLSNGSSSSTTALGLSGNLSITVGSGSPTSIAIASTDTMSTIAGKIATAGLRVQASIVYDGSNYHLLVAGLDTGASNAITFNESGLSPGTGGYTLGLSTAGNQIQAAQNASVTVGGIAITSATNQITNAIPGVTLAITQKTASPATVSITSDSSAMQQKVQAFVNAYNAVVSAGHTDAGFGTQAAANPLLQGDFGVRSSLDQLGSLMAEPVPGTSGTYTTLASAGVTLNDDGTMALDTTKLSAAISADPTSVERLFVTDPTNGSQGVMATIGSLVDSLSSDAGNPLQAEQNAFSSRSQQIGSEMSAMQQRIAAYQTQLQAQFTQMNTMLAQYKQIAASLNNGSNSSSNNGVL